MSLYEQFHSNINKDFMFRMVKDVIQKEINFDITIDSNNYDYFLSTFEKVFNDNNFEEIEQANKIILDTNVDYFLKKIKKPGKQIENDFERMIKERQLQDNNDKVEGLIRVQSEPIIKELIKEPEPIQKPIVVNEETKEVKLESTKFNSSQRMNINSSRYNYRIDPSKHNLQLNHQISKLILPIEENYLFSIPVINILIPELDYNIHMQREEIIEGGHRKYGVYESIETSRFLKELPERITIEVRDITGRKFPSSDILKVNIMEIKKGKIYFTCSLIGHNDFHVKDYIKIINNNSNTLFNILQEPLKIKKIQGNMIICEYNGLIKLEDDIYTDIDMKIMNMSNQNIFYLSGSVTE